MRATIVSKTNNTETRSKKINSVRRETHTHTKHKPPIKPTLTRSRLLCRRKVNVFDVSDVVVALAVRVRDVAAGVGGASSCHVLRGGCGRLCADAVGCEEDPVVQADVEDDAAGARHEQLEAEGRSDLACGDDSAVGQLHEVAGGQGERLGGQALAEGTRGDQHGEVARVVGHDAADRVSPAAHVKHGSKRVAVALHAVEPLHRVHRAVGELQLRVAAKADGCLAGGVEDHVPGVVEALERHKAKVERAVAEAALAKGVGAAAGIQRHRRGIHAVAGAQWARQDVGDFAASPAVKVRRGECAQESVRGNEGCQVDVVFQHVCVVGYDREVVDAVHCQRNEVDHVEEETRAERRCDRVAEYLQSLHPRQRGEDVLMQPRQLVVRHPQLKKLRQRDKRVFLE
eukprot:m.212747 g.212747  ORF g.212747 m.212747 type:complete len:400 (-) comp21352_c0_seq1:2748-3947(-)